MGGWSWKNWFLTISSTLGGCGGLERTGGNLKRTDFLQFLLSWKNWFLTISTLGGCGGLERTDF